MTAVRSIIRTLLPFLYAGVLLLAFPFFDGTFSEALSWLRVTVARVGTTVGMISEGNGVMLGIYKPEVPYSMKRLDTLERTLNGKFEILAFYQTWGEREEDEFPLDLMRAVDRHGAIAMVTWEPWTTEFARNKGGSPEAKRNDLQEIAGGVYDEYIRSWAKDATIFGRPFYLRFAHEMNNPQYPWSQAAEENPQDFVKAWRHVWQLFREVGAKNVVWVWSPKGAMPNELYPGGEYVDWIGAGVFNYGAYGDGVWHSFEYLYEPIYRSALRYEKPIMIAEIGCSALGGSKEQWLLDAMRGLRSRYIATKALVLYNNPADQSLQGSVIDWSIDGSSEILELLAKEIESGIFKKR